MGSSKSSSQANQTTNTSNADRRLVNESGIVATEGGIINANVQRVDADIVNHALDTIRAADAIHGEGLDKLLSAGLQILEGGAKLTEQSQATVMQTLQNLENDKKGDLSQKTIVIMTLAAAGAFAAHAMGKK